MTHASNAQVSKTSLLVNGINLDLEKIYDLVKILVNLENLDLNNFKDNIELKSGLI